MEKKTKIIGRVDECSRLKECMDADSAQLIIVYGRRRVGKACPIGQVLLVILLGRYCQGGFYMIDEKSIARRIREERRKAGDKLAFLFRVFV